MENKKKMEEVEEVNFGSKQREKGGNDKAVEAGWHKVAFWNRKLQHFIRKIYFQFGAFWRTINQKCFFNKKKIPHGSSPKCWALFFFFVLCLFYFFSLAISYSWNAVGWQRGRPLLYVRSI